MTCLQTAWRAKAPKTSGPYSHAILYGLLKKRQESSLCLSEGTSSICLCPLCLFAGGNIAGLPVPSLFICRSHFLPICLCPLCLFVGGGYCLLGLPAASTLFTERTLAGQVCLQHPFTPLCTNKRVQSRNPSRTSCSRTRTQSTTGRDSPSTNRRGHPSALSSI